MTDRYYPLARMPESEHQKHIDLYQNAVEEARLLRAKLEATEKQAAAMREALEAEDRADEQGCTVGCRCFSQVGDEDPECVACDLGLKARGLRKQALSSNAGKNYVPLSELETAQKQAAAMREALEDIQGQPLFAWFSPRLQDPVRKALSSDAGRDWVRREESEARVREYMDSNPRTARGYTAADWMHKADQLRAERDALKGELTTEKQLRAAVNTESAMLKRDVKDITQSYYAACRERDAARTECAVLSKFTVYWLRRSYEALSRSGYEEGPSSEETRGELNDVLSNLGHEPMDHPVPEPVGFHVDTIAQAHQAKVQRLVEAAKDVYECKRGTDALFDVLEEWKK